MTDELWGTRLRRLREARRLSHAELAAACAALGHYRESDLYPRVPTFAAMARVLGVSMEVLFYGEEEAARIAEERERLVSEGSSCDA